MTTRAELEAALASCDPESRRRAVEFLREPDFAAESPAPLLLVALGDDDWRVRKQAVEVVRSLAPSPELLLGLVRVLEPGDNVGLRNAAVEALGAFGEAALSAIAEKLPTLDADGKKLAAEALSRTLLPAALNVLRPLSTDSDANVRAAAIDAVAAVGSTAPVAAFDLLSGVLGRVREAAFVRLSALDGINRLGALLPWTSIESMLGDPVLERSAFSAAGRSRHPEAWGALLSALERARGGRVSAVLAALLNYARAFSQNTSLLRQGPASEPVTRQLLALASHGEDLASRKAALVVAGALGIEGIAPIAAEALSDVRLLAEADEALGLLGSKALPALLERLASADPETCAACIEIVTGLIDTESASLAVATICKWVDSGAPVVVRAGLGALTRLGDETCFGTISAWLPSEHAGSAAENALAALAQRYPEAARTRARAASAQGAEAHFAAVIQGALPAPIRASVAEDIAYLSLLLSNPSKVVRRAALAGLGNAKSELGADAAAFALTDEEPEVRHAAVHALSRLRSDTGALVGLGKLLDIVEKSPDQELVAAALAALADAGDARLLGVLRPLVHSVSPLLAVAAIEALARVPDARRVEALIEGLSHHEPEVVKAAMIALGDAIDARLLAHFGVCLEHGAWDVRRLAADLLGRANAEPARALLRTRLGSEDNPRVLEAISRAVEAGGHPLHAPPPPRAGSLRPR